MAKKNKKLNDVINPMFMARNNPDIAHWRGSLSAAESRENPMRKMLYDVYRETLLDDQIITVTERIKNRCRNSTIKFLQNNEYDPEHPINKILSKSVAGDIITWIIESRWWGFSLIEFTPDFSDLTNIKAELIERDHVRPEFSDVVTNFSDSKGIRFDLPPHVSFVMPVGKPRDLGLLNPACPLVIYKRFGGMFWFELLEVYGSPVITVEYDPDQPGAKREAEKALDEAGGSVRFAVPKGNSTNIAKGADTSSSNMFKDAEDTRNKAISKIFLGGSMTIEQGSSRSQAEVHLQGEDDVITAYKVMVEQYLNEKWLELLKGFGYDTEGGTCQYDDVHTLVNLAKIIKLLLEAGVSRDYISKRFNIPLEDVKQPEQKQEKEPGTAEKKKHELKLQLPNYELVSCCDDDVLKLSENQFDLSKTEKELLKKAWDNKSGAMSRKYFFDLADILTEGIDKGWATNKVDYNSPDHTKKRFLDLNVFTFSAAKSMSLSQQINEVRKDAKNFKDFEQKVGKITSKYNGAWLETEYINSEAIAQNAANYTRQMEAGLPYLEYQTVGDKRVRPAHEKLDGMIFDIDDPAIDEIYPPNKHRCRCNMVARSEKKGKKLSNLDSVMAALGEEYESMKEGGWNLNRGKAQQVFTANEMYLKNFNINKLDWKTYQLKEVTKLKSPTLKAAPMAQKEAKEWFESKVGNFDLDDKDKIRFVDYLKRPIDFDKSTLVNLNTEQLGLLNQIESITDKPNEVWANLVGENYTLSFIKFFKNEAVVIEVQLKKNMDAKILSINKVTNEAIDNYRKGLLIKNQ